LPLIFLERAAAAAAAAADDDADVKDWMLSTDVDDGVRHSRCGTVRSSLFASAFSSACVSTILLTSF